MINSLSKVNYGYTDKGNLYEKSSVGKKVGTAVGCGAGLAFGYGFHSLANLSHEMIKFQRASKGKADMQAFFSSKPNIIKDCIAPKKIWESIKRSADIFGDFYKSKSVGYVRALIPLAIGVAITAGLGGLIGHSCDKIVDHSAMKKADKAAEA